MNFKAILKRALPFLLTLIAGVFLGSLFVFSKEDENNFLPPPVTILMAETQVSFYVDDYVYSIPDIDFLSLPEPIYPQKAFDYHYEGNVFLEVELKTDASVGDIKILKSKDYGLTESAVKAAKAIRFIPSIYKGKAITTKLTLVYIFRLKNFQ